MHGLGILLLELNATDDSKGTTGGATGFVFMGAFLFLGRTGLRGQGL